MKHSNASQEYKLRNDGFIGRMTDQGQDEDEKNDWEVKLYTERGKDKILQIELSKAITVQCECHVLSRDYLSVLHSFEDQAVFQSCARLLISHVNSPKLGIRHKLILVSDLMVCGNRRTLS